MRHPASAAIVFLLAFTSPLWAQAAPSPSPLTVDQAVELALKNNLELKQAEQDLVIARAELNAAWADLYMPSLQLTGSFGYTDPVSVSNPYNDSWSAGLLLRKDLFSGGKYWFAKEGKRRALDYAEFKFREKAKEIARFARLNFFGLLLLKEKLRIAREYDKSLQYRLESARLNYRNGIVSELDYLKEQVKHKNNQPLLLKAKNDYRLAGINFANYIGLPEPDGFEPAGDIQDALLVALKSNDEATLLAGALARDATLRGLDYEIAANQAAREAALAARWPTLSGSFNYKFDYKAVGPDRAFLPGWTASLSLAVPLDPWLPGISRLSQQTAAADALIAKKELQRQQAEAGLRVRIKTLLANLALAEEGIAGQKENVRQAKLVLDIASRQFREGSLSSLDLSDAEIAYSQALANYWQALFDRYANALALNDYLE